MPVSKRLCVAVDNSTVSGEALDWAARQLVCPHDEVHLVTVVPPQPAGPSQDPVTALPILYTADPDPEIDMAAVTEASPWREAPREEHSAAQHMLDEYAQQARHTGISNVTPVSLTASTSGPQGIGASICRYTQEHGCDSLVMGNRGLGIVSRSLLGVVGLGSVSEYCVKHAPVPVTVYNSPKANSHRPPRSCASGAASNGSVPTLTIPDYIVSA